MYHVGMGADPVGLKSLCEWKGIQFMAYSPLGEWSILTLRKATSLVSNPLTVGIGKAYGKSGAQVALRWVVQNGVPVVTVSSKEKHLAADLDIFNNFTLSSRHMDQLNAATSPPGNPVSTWSVPGLLPGCKAEADVFWA